MKSMFFFVSEVLFANEAKSGLSTYRLIVVRGLAMLGGSPVLTLFLMVISLLPTGKRFAGMA